MVESAQSCTFLSFASSALPAIIEFVTTWLCSCVQKVCLQGRFTSITISSVFEIVAITFVSFTLVISYICLLLFWPRDLTLFACSGSFDLASLPSFSAWSEASPVTSVFLQTDRFVFFQAYGRCSRCYRSELEGGGRRFWCLLCGT